MITESRSRPKAKSAARVAVLLSGRGSNYESLQRAVLAGNLPAEIVLVLSDHDQAPGLEKARHFGVEARAIPRRGEPSREAHESKLLEALDAAGTEWICLAGFMRLLSTRFVERYRWRILNIHPSLLPSFSGLFAHQQAIEHGVRISGCTVHLVDAGLDSGPIVVQRAVPVSDQDDVDALASRVLVEEHSAYPEALNRLLVEPWRIEGRRVLFQPAES